VWPSRSARCGAVRCSPEEGRPLSGNEARGLPDEERNGRIMTHAHRFAASLTACLVSVLPARTTGQVPTQYELTPLELPAELAGNVVTRDPETGTTLQLTLGSSFTTVTGINDRGEIVGHTEGTYFGPDFSFEAVRAFPFSGAPVH
jgi:hypothetical protein